MKKFFTAATAMVVAFAALAAAPSQAADPVQPEIRLLTPALDDNNSWNGQDSADLWVGNGWFPEGLTYRQTWAPIGSKIIFTYLVTNAETGAPIPNQTVNLRVNKAWSIANAIVKVNGSNPTNGIEKWTGVDQLKVSAKTDANGIAVFVMEDMGPGFAYGEPEPASLTERGAPFDENSGGDPLISYYTQVMPEIMGEVTDITDITEVHFYQPDGNPSFDKSVVTARMTSPVLGDSTAVNRPDLENEFTVQNSWYPVGTRVFQKYEPVGKTTNLVFSVVDNAGAWLMDSDVSLSVNKAYSNSNASVTDGTTANNPALTDQDQARWNGVTDAFGTAYFKLTNTDTTGIAKPTNMTDPMPTENKLFSQLYLNVDGAVSNVADIVELFFYTVPKKAQTMKNPAAAVKVKKSVTLPAKSVQGVTLVWSTTTKSICKVVKNKVTGVKPGKCKVKATNTGNTDYLPFTISKVITVKK